MNFFRIWRVDYNLGAKRFDWANVIFAAYFILRGHDTMIRQLLSPSHSYFSFGIICGRLWGSLAVEDHLRSILGIICGTVQYPETLSEDWDDRETIIFIPVIESKLGLDGAEVEKK